jgi:hypothetical protein
MQQNRDVEDVGRRDLATCFRSPGDLVLLVYRNLDETWGNLSALYGYQPKAFQQHS